MADDGESVVRDSYERARQGGVASTMPKGFALSKVLVAALVVALGSEGRAQTPGLDTSRALREALAAQGIPLESVVGVHRTSRNVVVDTHINPSAGTIVVLTPDLAPVTTLPGWSLCFLSDGTILYHRSDIHFAPTHSVELWTWDGLEGAPSVTPRQDVVVACQDVGTARSRCTERPLAAVAREHPTWSTLQILDELAGNRR